jgi:hypothetical protein
MSLGDYLGDLKIRKIRMLVHELDHVLLDWRDCFAWGAEPMEQFCSGDMRVADSSNSIEPNMEDLGDLP